MIETGGVAQAAGKSVRHSSAKLRFNVPDIGSALEELRSLGITDEIQHHSWGFTIDVYDPDGNRTGIRDEPTFVAQIKN